MNGDFFYFNLGPVGGVGLSDGSYRPPIREERLIQFMEEHGGSLRADNWLHILIGFRTKNLAEGRKSGSWLGEYILIYERESQVMRMFRAEDMETDLVGPCNDEAWRRLYDNSFLVNDIGLILR